MQKKSKRKKTDKPILTDDPRNATQLHTDVLLNWYVFFLHTSSASTWTNLASLENGGSTPSKTSEHLTITHCGHPYEDHNLITKYCENLKTYMLTRHFTVYVHVVSQSPDCISTQINSNVLCSFKTMHDLSSNDTNTVF
jgi:hypothetical protein